MKRRIEVEENMTDTPCNVCIFYCKLGCNFMNNLFITPGIIKRIIFFMKNSKLTELIKYKM